MTTPERLLEHCERMLTNINQHMDVDGKHVRIDAQSFIRFLGSVINALQTRGVGVH